MFMTAMINSAAVLTFDPEKLRQACLITMLQLLNVPAEHHGVPCHCVAVEKLFAIGCVIKMGGAVVTSTTGSEAWRLFWKSPYSDVCRPQSATKLYDF